MESEKVKQILDRLHCKLLGDRKNEINPEEKNCVGQVITLINELESENERIKNIGLNEEMTVGEFLGQMQQLKDRIAELEKEVETRKEEVLHLQEYGKKLIRETELKQFTERLKEKLEEGSPFVGYDLEDLELDGETIQGCIDETLKEFVDVDK